MDMPMSLESHSKIENITGVQRRRRWTPEQKLAWVRRTTEPGINIGRRAYLTGRSKCFYANAPQQPDPLIKVTLRP
jgi:hypothetical protein